MEKNKLIATGVLLVVAGLYMASRLTGVQSADNSSAPAGSTASASASPVTASRHSAPTGAQPAAGKAKPAAPVTKLVKQDLVVGKGTEAKTGDTVSVHYSGTLTDGSEFDSSLKRNEPFSFTLGAGTVIPGWDQGVPGMKVGGKRKLTIPSDLAYGPAGHPPVIPPNATLIFVITLLDVKSG